VSDLKLEFVDMASPVTATLNFDGHACSYRGHLSETEVGALICADVCACRSGFGRMNPMWIDRTILKFRDWGLL